MHLLYVEGGELLKKKRLVSRMRHYMPSFKLKEYIFTAEL